MTHLKKTFVFLLIVSLFFSLQLSSRVPASIKGYDLILNAMAHELQRSIKSLVIEGMGKPYFIEYAIWDCYKLGIDAAFGSLINSEQDHQRFLKVGLRVGSYQLDNTGFVQSYGAVPLMPGYLTTVVQENDYDAIRHDIWLATDKAYKDSLAQIAGKEAYMKNHLKADKLPDFTRSETSRMLLPRKFTLPEKKRWEKTIKEISAIFRGFPKIKKSKVRLLAMNYFKYYLNSEGTVFRVPASLNVISASAVAQTADGMIMKHFIPFCANDLKDLPSKELMIKKVTRMARELESLVDAPVLKEEYIGPVLFTGQAAAELFIQGMVSHFSGQRTFISEIPSVSRLYPVSKLARRINRSILPDFISITDNPGIQDYNGQNLFGYYMIDDEGVKPQKVNLVDRGIFKSLLMTRRPHKKISKSNGHARASVLGANGIQISNLIFNAEKGKSYKSLKKELIDLCVEQQLDYGIIIKTLDDPALSGFGESRGIVYGSRPNNLQISHPILMYRVSVKDGREELVRGITISDFTLRHFRDIYSVGKDSYVYNRLMPNSSNSWYSYFAFSEGGDHGMVAVPVSVVVPSILFDELEFKKTAQVPTNPPVLSHPYFSQKGKGKRNNNDLPR